MTCANYFTTTVKKDNSQLYEDLVDYFNSTSLADKVYNDIIKSGVWNEDSFLYYLDKKRKEEGDFLKTLQDEPDFSVFIEWREYLKKRAATQRVFATNNISTDAVEFLSIMEGFSSTIPNVLKQKGMSFIDMVSSRTNTNNILNETKNEFLRQYRQSIARLDPELQSRHSVIADEIDVNFFLFKDAFNEFLHSEIGIKFDQVESEYNAYNEAIQESENKTHKDSTFDKSAHEFSPFESAPQAIKLMFFTLTDTKDGAPVRGRENFYLNKLVPYSKASGMVHQTLVNIPADINIFLDELSKKADTFPIVNQLIEQLNFHSAEFAYDSDPARAMKQLQLRTQFVNQFNKSRYNYYLHVIDADGNLKVIDANLDKSTDVKLTEWENNLLLQMASNPKEYTDDFIKNVVPNANRFRKAEFAKWIGITPSVGENADTFYENLSDENISWIRDKVKSLKGLKEIYKKQKASLDVRSRFISLAKQALATDNTVVELQHFNVEGKLQYGISLNTYLTNKVKGLRYWAGNLEKLQEEFPELFNDPLLTSSVFAKAIKNELLAENENYISIGLQSGFINAQTDNRGITADLNERDLSIQRIYGILQEGMYNFPRAADRKLENVIKFDGLSGRGTLLNGGGLIVDVTDDVNLDNAVEYMINHLADEIAANALYKDLNVNGLSTITRETSRAFTLRDGTSIFSLKNLEGKTPIDLKKDKAVNEFIRKKLNEIIAEEEAVLAENAIFESDVESLIPSYGSFQNVINNYALNHFFGTLETVKLFAGDPMLYGDADNFFKRMSMFNSTKEGTRTDTEINDVVAGLTHLGEELAGSNHKREDSTIRSLTFEDIESSYTNENAYSQMEQEFMSNLFGKDNPYAKASAINEADGFALITYDEYRIMKMRYGQWDDVDEEIYQSVYNDPEYVFKKEHYGRIIPDKSQFVGKLQNEDLKNYNIVAGRKFAFMPMIPGLMPKGSRLAKLNEYMLGNSIGMAFFKSSSKFGYRTKPGENKPANKLYDSENENKMNIDPETIELLDYKDIGNQLNLVKDVDKGTYITESTQERKNLYSNFFRDGQPVDPENIELYTLIEDNLNIQSERIDRAYSRLSDKLGFSITDDLVEVKRFVDSVINMAKAQGFSTNELEALMALEELPYLDILINKPKVEQFLMAKLRNSAIRQKRKGESLAQVSNVGFEMSTGLSRQDLKFYRYSEDKQRMLPMEVYSPLPSEMIDYVSNKYNEGKGLTQKALDKFNRDIEKDNTQYEKTGEMTNLTKLTLMSGFRTPHQGPSSSDVAKVKRYYMPHIGGMVVVPKAMVLKTGSDFDIDKLNLYYPEMFPYKSKAQSFISKNFPSRQSKMKLIQREGLGYDVENLKDGELNRIIQDEILEADHTQLNTILAKTYNELYINDLKSSDANKFRVMKDNINNWYADHKGVSLKDLTDKQLNNRALENEIRIKLNKANWKQMMTPLSDKNLKAVRDDMRKITGYNPSFNLGDIFTAKNNINKMVSFLAGKAGVGQAAIHVVHHPNSQRAGIKMKAPHSYFGNTTTLSPVKETIVNEPQVKDLNDLVGKPDMNISFEKPEGLSKFGDIRKWEKAIERAENLQNTINKLWSKEKC